MRDLRLALRRLAHERAFALVAILTLAVGIGANTAIFSLVDGVLLRPLSYPQPQQLLVLDQAIPQFAGKYPYFPTDAASFHLWQQRSKLAAGIGAITPGSWVLTGAGEPREVYGLNISSSLFPTLRVAPALGRNFSASEDQPGRNHEVILSDAFWRSRFRADPAVIGRTLDLDGAPNTIVGVMPSGLYIPNGSALGAYIAAQDHPVQIFRPLGLNFAQLPPVGDFGFFVVARLRPGATAPQLRAELDALEAHFLVEKLGTSKLAINTVTTPLRDAIVGSHRLGLWLLLAAVAAILLIVCLNLANLLLVRIHSRGHELAIRAALGAARRRLIGETLLEGLVLSALGGLLGTAAAWLALRGLVHVAPPGIPRLAQAGLNLHVLAFAVALALVCGVLFSLWPALRSAAADPQSALRSGARGTSDAGSGLRARAWLVGAQSALAALLLILAGLLVASYLDLLGVHRGFQSDGVIAASLVWPGPRAQRLRFDHDILARLRALPGVHAAGLIDTLPTRGTDDTDLLSYVHDSRPLANRPLSIFSSAGPGYFAAAGVPLLRGRAFTAADIAASAASGGTAPVAALISATTALRLWPGQDPIGKQFTRSDEPLPFTVIGVVADVRTDGLDQTPGLQVYIPYPVNAPAAVAVLLRTTLPLAAIAPRIRAAVSSLQPAAALTGLETMAGVVLASVAARRFQMLLVLAFALAALFLAALGIYGVLAYSIARRAPEIGIRMALGANTASLIAMVLRQGLAPVLAGLALGVALALALGQYLASLLFGVRATDPAVLAAVSAVLLAAAVLACAIPAARAARINPVSILRN